MAIKLHGSFAVHPGAWLRTEIVEPEGLSATAAAETLGLKARTQEKRIKVERIQAAA